jgi:cardiolipin synthase
MPGWWTVPNLLTIFRIVMTPWIGLAISRSDYRTALPLLFVAGMSDAADGYLARRLKADSKLGKALDPIADKFLMVTVFLALAANGGLPWWMVGLALGRDLMILGFAAWAMAAGIKAELAPTRWGKLSTMLQMLLAGSVVLGSAFSLGWVKPVSLGLLWTAAAMTIWSGIDYARIGLDLSARHRRSAD